MSTTPKKEQNEFFTIPFDQVHDSGEIPDVAQLLGSQTRKQGVNAVNAALSPAAEDLRSLKEFETVLAVHFYRKENAYHYLQHEDYSQRTVLALTELFQGMKIPDSLLQQGKFQEFTSADASYLFDAFGVQEQTFIQILPLQEKKILTCYISGKTMKGHEDAVVKYSEQRVPETSASDQAA